MEGYVIESDKLPEWLRTTFVDEKGEVFLPCGAFADEMVLTLSAAYDGVPMVKDGRHAYAPASWLEREHPQYAHVVDVMVRRSRQAHQRRGKATPPARPVGSRTGDRVGIGTCPNPATPGRACGRADGPLVQSAG